MTGGNDLRRNFWGDLGSEVDGADSLVGLDVSTGAVNINVANFFFGVVLLDAGAPGSGNDIFIVDVQTTAGATVRPIDANGNLIGDFTLTLTSSDFGTVPDATAQLNWKLNGSHSSALNIGSPGNNIPINGVGFDLSDFSGTGTLTGVAGVQVSGGGALDPAVIGFNSEGVIPEPASLGLVGVSCLLIFGRRRAVRTQQ